MLGYSGASVAKCFMAFKSVIMLVSIYQLTNVVSYCLQSSRFIYFWYISLSVRKFP